MITIINKMSDFTDSYNSDKAKYETLKDCDTIRTIMTSDGQQFSVQTNHLIISKLIFVMLDESDIDAEDNIPVPAVNSKNFEKIVEFMKMYHENPMKEIEKPLRSNNLKDIVQECYADLINIEEEEELFSLIMASNYLDIQPLLNLGCAKVASMIKGKSPEEIRKIFDIGTEDENSESTEKITESTEENEINNDKIPETAN